MVRWCWVRFQCRGVLLIWIREGQGPTVLAMGAGGGCFDIFTLVYHFSFLSPSLWETTQYRLKYCPKGLLSPKQPTNDIFIFQSVLHRTNHSKCTSSHIHTPSKHFPQCKTRHQPERSDAYNINLGPVIQNIVYSLMQLLGNDL